MKLPFNTIDVGGGDSFSTRFFADFKKVLNYVL